MKTDRVERVERYYTIYQVANIYKIEPKEVVNKFKITKIGKQLRIAESDLH